jgi:hypothetical protein
MLVTEFRCFPLNILSYYISFRCTPSPQMQRSTWNSLFSIMSVPFLSLSYTAFVPKSINLCDSFLSIFLWNQNTAASIFGMPLKHIYSPSPSPITSHTFLIQPFNISSLNSLNVLLVFTPILYLLQSSYRQLTIALGPQELTRRC